MMTESVEPEDVEVPEEVEEEAEGEERTRQIRRKPQLSSWDSLVEPIQNGKPKRFIRCERSLGVSRKWWICDRIMLLIITVYSIAYT